MSVLQVQREDFLLNLYRERVQILKDTQRIIVEEAERLQFQLGI
jgi:hypothetical protein